MMARIRVADDSALALVYDQYAPMVHGIANQLVGADAADVCQDVFMDLWLRPDRFDPERGSLRTFIAVSTRRRCIDHLRSVGRRRARERRATDLNPVAPPNVDEAALAMVTADRVRRTLERLPQHQREALELAYLEGMTFRQVAVATGTAEGTAKSRLRLGLNRLAKELDTLRNDMERAEPT
jgi:RNA polymerase sigma-70 factor (ECF subfamily)